MALTKKITAENIIETLEKDSITITQTAKGTVQIQQTERNLYKTGLQSLVKSILTQGLPDTVSVDEVKDGIVLGIYNEATGETIAVTVDLTIKSLDYNIDDEIEGFRVEQEEKRVKAEKSAAAKAKKIESDRVLRERILAKKKEKENN